jgi:hypothetical protein
LRRRQWQLQESEGGFLQMLTAPGARNSWDSPKPVAGFRSLDKTLHQPELDLHKLRTVFRYLEVSIGLEFDPQTSLGQ